MSFFKYCLIFKGFLEFLNFLNVVLVLIEHPFYSSNFLKNFSNNSLGTFELSSESEEDIYEVINISKIKAHTPNLKVVNLYGITFLDDSHIELLASNCIHIECLALNFCLRVKGASFKNLIQRCKKLKTLLIHHAGKSDY